MNKGNQWYYGLKAHIGVDADSGLARGVQTTPGNVSDVVTAHALLHGGEEQVWGDAGYQGVGKREENGHEEVDWQVAMKAGKRRRRDEAGAQKAMFLMSMAQRFMHSPDHPCTRRVHPCSGLP